VVGGAGLLILTTYASLPTLTRVGASDAGDTLMLRKVLREGPEKALIVRLTGLSSDPAWTGGIANPAIQATVIALGQRHLRLTGMRQAYLDILGAIVALSPLRVRTILGWTVSEAQLAAYWRYMTYALALFGAHLCAIATATQECGCFIERHSGAGPNTHRYVAELFHAYPGHAATCLAALFPASRAVVDGLHLTKIPVEVTS
jgi:hypothetical protein